MNLKKAQRVSNFLGLILAGIFIPLFVYRLIFEGFQWMDLGFPLLSALFIVQGYMAFLREPPHQ